MQTHQLYRNYLKSNSEIAVRSSVGTWFGSLLTIGILVLTVEVVRLNRINIYLNAQNVTSNKASARNGEAILNELKEINKNITSIC